MSLRDDLALAEAADDPTMVALATHEKVKRDNTRLKIALGRNKQPQKKFNTGWTFFST